MSGHSCRWCAHFAGDNYCSAHDEIKTDNQAKSTNSCRDFANCGTDFFESDAKPLGFSCAMCMFEGTRSCPRMNRARGVCPMMGK